MQNEYKLPPLVQACTDAVYETLCRRKVLLELVDDAIESKGGSWHQPNIDAVGEVIESFICTCCTDELSLLARDASLDEIARRFVVGRLKRYERAWLQAERLNYDSQDRRELC